MFAKELIIEGARQNNLRNISLRLPHNKFITVTGVSGSGKSSLAFDTIFAEGQWRFIESLSTYARLFLEKLDRPEVDSIRNIRPAIALEQRNTVKSSRSSVGTVTEIYDYLRLLYSKIARPHCPECGRELKAWTPSSVAQELVEKYARKKGISVIATGEVTGQRPMSQTKKAMEIIDKEVGFKLTRPLIELGIKGRRRDKQMILAKKYKIRYPSPGGGCLLTDPNYSNRLKLMEADGFLDESHSFLFYLAKVGRMFRLDEGKYLFVGRENEDNLKLSEQKEHASLYIVGAGTPGPAIIGYGEMTEEDRQFAMDLFSRYSKGKGKDEIQLLLDGVITKVAPVDLEALAEKISKYQYTGQKIK